MGKIRALKIAVDLQKYLRSVCPYDTGNMSETIRLEIVSPDECRVIIGGEPAPYAVYTNEPWIADKWHGKKNPNQGWIDDAVKVFASTLAPRLKGEFSTIKTGGNE